MQAANPRHEHEWKVWKDAKLPDWKILAPGMIDTCSNYVEHPELIAQRIEPTLIIGLTIMTFAVIVAVPGATASIVATAF